MKAGLIPKSLEEALDALATGAYTPHAGGTDLMISQKQEKPFVFIGRLPELRLMEGDDASLCLGAALTFSEVLECEFAPPLLREAVSQIAAPAIRNRGTLGGNIANASPKADAALALTALGASIKLRSIAGERTLPIEEFYLGNKRTARGPGELITEIVIPKTPHEHYYQKVGERQALAISRLSFAGVYHIEGGELTLMRTAFGAIAGTILRMKEHDSAFIGTVSGFRPAREKYLEGFSRDVSPTRGRVSSKYRKAAALNILRDFFDEVEGKLV